MKGSYRVTPDGAFIVEPRATVKAVFDRNGGACTLALYGAVSEDKVLQVFDVLVPVKKRGAKKEDMIECAGGCERDLVYENVALATGSVGRQTSEPAAIITFSRSACKSAVAEAERIVLNIKRGGPNPAPR